MQEKKIEKTRVKALAIGENIGDNNLNDNFVGVFSSNCMSKFINHLAMTLGQRVK